MLLELIFVAAFALFAVFAWTRITAEERTAEFYRIERNAALDELEYRRAFQQSDSEHVSRLWEEVDTRRMEVKGLEHQLQDALDENEALREKLAGYWSMSN